MAAGTTAPPGLTLNLPSNLSSNNPFRNRATTPSPRHSPFSENPPPMRPISNNPFLDASEVSTAARRPSNGMANGHVNNTTIPDDIFGELSLLDRSATNELRPPMDSATVRSGSIPMQGNRPPFDPRRAPPRPPRGQDSPVKRDARPPQLQRRASESSIMEKDRRPRTDRDRERDRERAREGRPPRTESEERRRRERRREREERHKREKEKVRSGDKRTKKPQGLDIIDKLDVTGIYGQGLFHHDGPFDACNPHRNARKDRRAPMQAFPAGSANMALGGAGPLNSRLDLDRFHGRGAEGFSEYAATSKATTKFVDPTSKIEPVHGEETYGLGTSTFLEGAPAAKSALQRRDSDEQAYKFEGGLSRKKSLAQRFRGMSGSRRGPPNGQPGSSSDMEAMDSPPSSSQQIKAVSAGGPARAKYNKENESNPFENDYEAAFDKKGTQIRIAEQERPSGGRERATSSPKGLSRTLTSDGVTGRGSSNEEERPSGGGFLSRMRSLKGGPRRVRNDA